MLQFQCILHASMCTQSLCFEKFITACPVHSSGWKIAGIIPCARDMSERCAMQEMTSCSCNSHCCNLQCCSAAMHYINCQTGVYHCPIAIYHCPFGQWYPHNYFRHCVYVYKIMKYSIVFDVYRNGPELPHSKWHVQNINCLYISPRA